MGVPTKPSIAEGVLCLLAVVGEDGNRAVVVDVYLGAGLFGYVPDVLAAGAYELAYLVAVDLHCDYPGGVLAEFLPGTAYALVHFLKDVKAVLPGLLEGRDKKLLGYALHLEVHLYGVNSI